MAIIIFWNHYNNLTSIFTLAVYSVSQVKYIRCSQTLKTPNQNHFCLLLLLSRFSRVRLCATPQTAAHQAFPSLGFSRQEHWSGLPFPSPVHKSEKSESEVAQSCPTLRDPMDCSPPGSSAHGIFQAGVLEWGAIAFSASPTLKLKHRFLFQNRNQIF